MPLRCAVATSSDGGGAAAAAAAPDRPDASVVEGVDTIRVTVNGKIRKYVAAAKKVLRAEGKSQVVVFGEGRAVTKAISCAEVLKHRVIGLHQNTTIGLSKVTEVWEPKLDVEEDLDRVQVVRRVPNVTVLLSLTPLDPNAPGYQPPLPESEVTPDHTADDADMT